MIDLTEPFVIKNKLQTDNNIQVYIMRAIPFCLSIAFLCSTPTGGIFSLEAQGVNNLPKIIQLGESAYKKGDLRTAREAYREAIKLGGKQAPSPRNYFERSIRLAEIEYALGNRKASFHILTDLTRDPDLPLDILVQIETFRAKLLAESERAGPAYFLLTKAKDKVPLESWDKEDKTYYMSLEFLLEEHYADLLAKAERFSITGLYDQAHPIYKSIWTDMGKGFFPKAQVLEGKDLVERMRFLYAESIYHTSVPQKAIAILKPSLKEILEDPKYGTAIDLNVLYLASLCYRQLNMAEEAQETLESYLIMSSGNTKTDHYHEVTWDLGVTYFEKKMLEEAEKKFISLKTEAPSEKLHFSSELYLARINLEREEHYEANQRLRKLSQKISSKNPLKFELAYLLGEVAFQKKQYGNALTFFEKAIPKRNIDQASWYPALLKKQAFSYLRLTQENSDAQAKESYFRQAEKLLLKLTSMSGEAEEGVIELSRAYLEHARALNKPKYFEKVEKLLTDDRFDFSNELKGQSLLLRAEASDSFSFRESLFRTLFENSDFEDTLVRKKAFFYQGVNHMMHAREEIPEEAKAFWEQADRYFTFAIEELGKENREYLSQALKLRAETRYQLGSKQHLIDALKDIQNLFSKDTQYITLINDSGEVYHLQGLASAKLYKMMPNPTIVNLAKKSLGKVIDTYQDMPYAAEALYTLGALNFQIENYKDSYSNFNKYIRLFPRESDIDHALFWSAESANVLGMSQQTIREIRNRLFDSFPDSPLAPLAYLNYYSFQEYLDGNEAATSHLKKMYHMFPSSPYIITSFYLLGLNEKKQHLLEASSKKENLNKALGYFKSAQDSFQHFNEAHAIPAQHFLYLTSIRFQSELERAITFFLISEDESAPEKQKFEASVQGQKVLKSIISEFSDHQNMVTQALLQEDAYPKSLEEAEYTLAQSYLKDGRMLEARKLLTQMLERYQTANQEEGYYLSRSLYELGLLKIDQEKWEPALYYLNKSSEAASLGTLSEEQLLLTHIQKSTCLKELKDYTEAIKHLSSVINSDYPSDLRIQAMVIKAEILDLMGQREQAVRILKASANEKGEWSMRAKTKLKEYGFN